MSSIAKNLHSHKPITVRTNVPNIEDDFNRLEHIIPKNSIKDEKTITHIVNFLIRLKPSEDGPKIKDADTYLIKLLKIMNKLDEKTDYFNNNTARLNSYKMNKLDEKADCFIDNPTKLNSYNLLVKICNHEYLKGRKDIIGGMYSLIGHDIIWMTYYINDYKAEYDKYINMICNTVATFNASNHIDPTLAEEIHFNILMSAIDCKNNELIDTYCVNIFSFRNDSNILELMRMIIMQTTPKNTVIHLKLICSILETGELTNLPAKFDILNTFISYCTEILRSDFKYKDIQVIISDIPTILRNFIIAINQKSAKFEAIAIINQRTEHRNFLIEKNIEIPGDNKEVDKYHYHAIFKEYKCFNASEFDKLPRKVKFRQILDSMNRSLIQQENETIIFLINSLIEKILNTSIGDLLNSINNKAMSNNVLKEKLNQLIDLAKILMTYKMNITEIIRLVNVLYERFKSPNASGSHKSYLCNLLKDILENTESLPSEQCNYINEMLSLDEGFVDVGLDNQLYKMSTAYENKDAILIPNEEEDFLIIDTNATPTNNNNVNSEEELNILHTKLNIFNEQVNLNTFANNNREPDHSGDEYKQSNHITPTNGNENSLYTIHRLITNR